MLLALLSISAASRGEPDPTTPDATEPTREHGLVGLRPLPRDQTDLDHDHGGTWAGMPTFAEQAGQYPTVAERLDVVKGWLDGDFKTKRMFFEHYWGLSSERDDPDPAKNALVAEIRRWEAAGGTIEHILICREARLAVDRGWPDAKLGPFEEDGRILSAEDVAAIRKLFRDAHAAGLTKFDDYALLQMVEHPTFFATDAAAQTVVKQMEGVAYEAHQFNRHWPLEGGWSDPGKVARGAQWTLEQDLDYVFYFGPIDWKGSPHYKPQLERKWMQAYWAAGLPKHDSKMHYYLNLFPHATGRGRPVGPESDPDSILGFTKWVIEQIKGPAE